MVYASSRAGKLHDASEDRILVGTEILSDTSAVLPMPTSGFICIADGVGGSKGGAQASQFVTEALSNYDGVTDLSSYLSTLNQDLISFSSGIPSCPNMATTLTGFYFSDSNCRVLHIGNTRAYIKQGNYLKQITSDHTTFNWLISSGQTEAADLCNRSEITNCFGGGDHSLLSRLYIKDCQPFSLAVLTSDGIHDYLDIDRLEDILMSADSYDAACSEIIQCAYDSGSEDDLSVVIIYPLEG